MAKRNSFVNKSLLSHSLLILSYFAFTILPVRSFLARSKGIFSGSHVRTLSAFSQIQPKNHFGSTSSLKMSVCSSNPLLESWAKEPFHLPPFSHIESSHFEPAFEEGMKEHLADLQAIVDTPADASDFKNIISKYDQAGSSLSRISSVFSNMCSSLNTPELQKVQTTMSPILSRHSSSTYTLPGLFEKIKAIHEKRSDMGLNSEQVRLVERIYMDFTRAGADFDEDKKKEYADIKAELAELSTKFAQNMMKDEETYEIILSREDMEGCPDSLIESARTAAEERGKKEDEYVITLSRSLVEPFITYSPRRDLREKAWRAWSKRGELSPERDNLKIGTAILRLRKRQAEYHGYKTFADYQCVDRMAKTPKNVMNLLENVWERAKESANRERVALEQYVKESGDDIGPDGIQPWDWRYYAEKVRVAKYDFDESLLKPYFSLPKITEAVMAVSNNLFGLKYVKRPDIVAYHPDVDVYEVRKPSDNGTDKLVAIFIHDNYARPYKSSGAWMSEYRCQSRNLAPGADPMEGIPIISNNNNFAKGKNTLLSFDDATTLFHEMGHGHHGMLSDATYERLASTNVLTDFVELPSQLMEHWLKQPEVLKKYATHFETGEVVPDDLLAKLEAASKFNQGFATIEYTVCALLDMALHQMEDYPEDFDLAEFEKTYLEKIGMPKGIIMRHRPAHFAHLFYGSHYAAGYYVYLWAEVLDADAFAAFKETGNVFDKETAEKARKFIYSAGNTVAPDELFRSFRGRDPDINYMLEKKGLTNVAEAQ